ncbi:hypothetical protein QOZ75_29570, partial [Pseudomonas aeruginosa]|uniref:hypothetical protein n=1 Tax=Pseudomonas aeruginosa TaxID=287 RepID=UPI0034582BDA
ASITIDRSSWNNSGLIEIEFTSLVPSEENNPWGYIIIGDEGGEEGGCLLEGTEVILSNGETKEIQDLTLGDKLLSYNIETLPLYSDDP